MPQAILPLFTEDMTIVGLHVGVVKREGTVYYFQGCYPFYHHREDDRASFILHAALFCDMSAESRKQEAVGRWRYKPPCGSYLLSAFCFLYHKWQTPSRPVH
jgi:hypothetical protein